jgi:hypothetical protein
VEKELFKKQGYFLYTDWNLLSKSFKRKYQAVIHFKPRLAPYSIDCYFRFSPLECCDVAQKSPYHFVKALSKLIGLMQINILRGLVSSILFQKASLKTGNSWKVSKIRQVSVRFIPCAALFPIRLTIFRVSILHVIIIYHNY